MIILLLFVVAPIIELYVIIKTAQAIGVLNTIAAIVAIAVLGSWLIKREGLRVWKRFATQVQSGQVPSKEIADGLCLLIAGALMLAPGFVSDAVALLLLFPPTRAPVRGWLMRRNGLGGLGRVRVIRASHAGPTKVTDVTEATSTESRAQLDP